VPLARGERRSNLIDHITNPHIARVNQGDDPNGEIVVMTSQGLPSRPLFSRCRSTGLRVARTLGYHISDSAIV
jgi:hypothetical protein